MRPLSLHYTPSCGNSRTFITFGLTWLCLYLLGDKLVARQWEYHFLCCCGITLLCLSLCCQTEEWILWGRTPSYFVYKQSFFVKNHFLKNCFFISMHLNLFPVWFHRSQNSFSLLIIFIFAELPTVTITEYCLEVFLWRSRVDKGLISFRYGHCLIASWHNVVNNQSNQSHKWQQVRIRKLRSSGITDESELQNFLLALEEFFWFNPGFKVQDQRCQVTCYRLHRKLMTELGLELTSQFSVSIFSRQDIGYRENYLFGGGGEVII